jgi:DNA-binding MarR family transcriptional regulator
MVHPDEVVGEALFALGAAAVRTGERRVSLTALSTLSNLERTGSRRLTDLAGSEGVTQPSMTAVVNQLEALRLAARRGDRADRRVVNVAITAAGRQYLRTLRRAGAAVFTSLIEELPEAEASALRTALPALRHLAELAGAAQIGQSGPSVTTPARATRTRRSAAAVPGPSARSEAVVRTAKSRGASDA